MRARHQLVMSLQGLRTEGETLKERMRALSERVTEVERRAATTQQQQQQQRPAASGAATASGEMRINSNGFYTYVLDYR